ncbi:hypothetical protein C8R45DRAFT_1091048 [Mycena sanguinolenta]|nr:hypothetical protein C8R45DRAFT_1091048 [Mycena sanguinolenta]
MECDAMAEFLQADAECERLEDLAQDEELLRIMMSPTPPASSMTDEECKKANKANLALGIALSKKHREASPRLPASSSSSSSSALPIVSSSSSSSSAVSVSANSRTTALHPVYPPGKTADANQPTRCPKMTTQMSDTWMREYKDNTAADAATLKLGKYKTALDLCHGRKLTLVFWGLTSDRATVLGLDLHASPHWPHWALTDSAQLLLWVEVTIDFRHKLVADGHLFLCIPGTACKDFETVYSSVTAQPVNIRSNLPRDRRSICTKAQVAKVQDLIEITSSDDDEHLPWKKQRHSQVEESDGEVQIVETIPDTVINDGDDEEEFPHSVSLPQHPRLSITIPAPMASASTTSSTSMPSLNSSFSTTPSSSSLPSPATSVSSESRSVTPAPPKLDLSQNFPAHLYVTEVVASFRAMRSPGLQKLPLPTRFQQVFGRPYKKQTYSDALSHWELATEAEHQEGLEAGRTPRRLWMNWQRAIPLQGPNARKCP